MTPQEADAEVVAARQAVKDAEAALNFAEDRLTKALRAQEVANAVGTRPAEFKPYDNDVPQALYVRARQVGLRDFFSAPKGGGEG